MIYVVKPGDTLSKIAHHFKTTVDQILRANPSVTNPNSIFPGTQLNIQAGSGIGIPALQGPQVPGPQMPGPNSVFTVPGGTNSPAGSGGPKISWGAKVSAAFKAKVITICGRLQIKPDYLMAAMAFESGESFSSSKKNTVSGATGLIQFMPSTASHMGTTTAALAALTPEDQLDYVEKYFKPHAGKLHTLEDVYMAILWPAAIGKPNDHVLFSQGTKAYTQNAGLDANKDGHITKAEAAAKVHAKLVKGQGQGYYG